jgi:hypothetical protein
MKMILYNPRVFMDNNLVNLKKRMNKIDKQWIIIWLIWKK